VEELFQWTRVPCLFLEMRIINKRQSSNKATPLCVKFQSASHCMFIHLNSHSLLYLFEVWGFEVQFFTHAISLMYALRSEVFATEMKTLFLLLVVALCVSSEFTDVEYSQVSYSQTGMSLLMADLKL